MRWGEMTIVGLWLVSMTWLLARDVVPRWFAQAPPSAASMGWLERNGKEFQYDLSGPGIRGQAWTVYNTSGDHQVTRTDILEIGPLSLIGGLLISSEMVFLHENELDTVDVRLWGGPLQVELRGERQGPQFAFRMKIGTFPAEDFILDAAAAQTLSDTIKPFAALRDLHVGQTWQIHTIDPLSILQHSKARVNSVWAEVTGREPLPHRGAMHDCFVIQAGGVRAWVDESGRPLLQLVELPGLGSLSIRETSFDQSAYDIAQRQIHHAKRDGVRAHRID